MMKCPYCGAPLGLEDNFCSHCGKLNEQVQQHVEDMQRYHTEFTETKEEVYETTARYKGVSIRAVVIAVLMVLCVIAYIVLAESYSIVREIKQADNEKHYEEYSAIMDGYLEDGDYHAFYAFIEEHNIHYYDSKYESYDAIGQMIYDYTYIYGQMCRNTIELNEEETSDLEFLISLVNDYYEIYDKDSYSYIDFENLESEQMKNAAKDIHMRIEQMLITFCNVSAEEVVKFPTYSDTQRAVCIEEGIKNGQK